MPRYDREELQAILEKAVTHAQGWERDEVDANRQDALKAYLGKPRGDELAGRSHVQSMDVADMVNSDLSQLTPMLSTDIFAAFKPNSEEDEEQVEAETRAVNKVIMEDQQGYVKFHIAIKDALLMRNAVLKVFMHEAETAETFNFEGLSDEEVAFILQDVEPNQEAELVSRKGQDATIRITTSQRTPMVENVDPRHVLYTRNWYKQQIQDIPFFGQRHFWTRSEMVEMGFPKDEVDMLPSDPPLWYPIRRDVTNDNYGFVRDVDEVEVYECYIQLDMDDDGIVERYRAHWCNNNIIGEVEPVPWVPYATGTAMIYPHEWMGESMYDRLKDLQDIGTASLRQWIDNLSNGNNARTAADVTRVNMDDMTNTRPQAVIRTKGSPGDALMPMPLLDVGQSALQLLEYKDKLRTERGGAALDMASAEAQLVGDTAHGVERQYSSKELTVQMYGKALAETLIAQTYQLMHQTLRTYSNEPMMMKHSGQWIEVDPSQWPQRTEVNVVVGQTAGQRNASQQALFMSMQMALQEMQMAPGQIVDMAGYHKMKTDWLKMAGIDAPEQYFVDPNSPQAQQAAQAQQQQQQQMQAMQMQLHQQQVELDKYKHDTELQYKYFDSALDADVKEGETLSKVQVEAAKLASGNVNAERDREEGAKDRTASNSNGSGQ